jgi:hypothetical protein
LNRRHDITITFGICPGHIDDRLGINPDPFSDLPAAARPPTGLIELQQDPRPTDLLRRMRTSPDHPGQPLTLISAQHHRQQHRPRHDTSSRQGTENCRLPIYRITAKY